MIIDDGGELDGEWLFLIEDVPLEPETPRWTFGDKMVVDSSHPDAPGYYFKTGNNLTIVFPASFPDRSAFVATFTAPPIAVDGVPIDPTRDPNSLSGSFTQTIDGIECGDPYALWRDGPWLDDLKKERASSARLHRPADDADPEHYPLTRIVIEIQAPRVATVETMPGELDEIADRLRSGETAFAAEALFGYRVTVDQADTDMFAPIEHPQS